MKGEKKLTVGIPAFHADKELPACLASIQMQTIADDISVIIAPDYPDETYDYLEEMYPNLDILMLPPPDENTGPGLARQRALDACETDWITFIDADDVFMNALSLESLISHITPGCIEVQGPFYQEVTDHPQGIRIAERNDPSHPWVFGRCYNVKFLRENDISFSDLRAMEDGEFNWKIRMLIEGSQLTINVIREPIYFWRVGSEHSITKIGRDKKGIPQYNFDLCQIGATVASIRAAKFCKEKNPFNGSITRFITEMMVGHYFTYVECKEKRPEFAEQNFFNAKRFYYECFKDIENQITDKVLKDIYTVQYAAKGMDLVGIIPDITFFEFMEEIKTEDYGGEEELKAIREKLPKEIIDNDLKTGVAVF